VQLPEDPSTPFKLGLRREKVFGSRSVQRQQQHDGQHLNRRQSSSDNAAAVQLVDEVLANTDSQQQLEMLDLDLILAADSDGDGTVTAANAPAGETNKRFLVTFTTQIDGVQSESRHRSSSQGTHIYVLQSILTTTHRLASPPYSHGNAGYRDPLCASCDAVFQQQQQQSHRPARSYNLFQYNVELIKQYSDFHLVFFIVNKADVYCYHGARDLVLI
jgi:hypothetical protein